jgi:hypothetical protein
MWNITPVAKSTNVATCHTSGPVATIQAGTVNSISLPFFGLRTSFFICYFLPAKYLMRFIISCHILTKFIF